jgi:hypothetical protein
MLVVLVITASSAAVASASGFSVGESPSHVTGATFGVPARYPLAVGDTWFNTWAADGSIYATSNDTAGFNGTCNSDIAVNELAGDGPGRLNEPFINCMTSFGHGADGRQAGPLLMEERWHYLRQRHALPRGRTAGVDW